MILCSWDKLPDDIKNSEVKPYYDFLCKKKISIVLKRIFDVIVSLILIIILSPLFLIFSVWIKADSKGPIFFCQRRVTRYGKTFKIIKFRTMIENAEKFGAQVTVKNDMRVTKPGHFLRKYRFDEIPQLINVLIGQMSFVGTRPEVERYVNQYTNVMKATLLLPAGITSFASINFKDEEKLLKDAQDADYVYVNDVLPQKMKYNLKELENFSFIKDIVIIFKTVFEVFK